MDLGQVFNLINNSDLNNFLEKVEPFEKAHQSMMADRGMETLSTIGMSVSDYKETIPDKKVDTLRTEKPSVDNNESIKKFLKEIRD